MFCEVLSSGECGQPVQSWCPRTWHTKQSASREKSSQLSDEQLIKDSRTQQHLRYFKLRPKRSSSHGRIKQPTRSRQHTRTELAVKESRLAKFLGTIEFWSQRRWGRKPSQTGSRSKDCLGSGSWPWRTVLGSFLRIQRVWCCRSRFSVKMGYKLAICLLQYMEDPGMIDGRICGSNSRQRDTSLLQGIRNMRKGSSFDLEKCYPSFAWPRDASLRWMYTSHGVLMETSTYRCGENLAIAIAHNQRASSFWWSHDPSIVVDVGELGNKHSSALGK